MWCPNCGSEYEKGIETCADCGCKLTDQKPEPVTVKGQDIDALEKLQTCGNDFEADVLISLLDSCGIIGVKRYKSFSQLAKLYCGTSNLGVDVYVSSKDLADAKEILTAQIVYEDITTDENGEPDEEG